MTKSIAKYIALSLAVIVVLGAQGCRRSGTGSGEPVVLEDKEPVVLEYLRIWDEKTALDEIITSYQEQRPNVKIIVRKANILPNETIYDYQQDLIKQIADGEGPDIFMMHNDWLPFMNKQISPMPSGLLTVEDYTQKFPQVVVDDFVANNKIYALPYSIDNLMLFWNTELLGQAKVKPPRTWQELVDIVPKLTVYGPGNTIKQSAISFGVADGMPRFAEILANLMMQYGAEMTSPDHTKATFDLPAPNSDPPYFSAREALDFYTSFADPSSSTYTYTDARDRNGDLLFPEDVQAFIEGRSAMFIGYSYHVEDIKKFAPRLFFETSKLPQLRLEDPVVMANYWGEAVSKNSQYPNVAWDFINFVTTRTNMNRFFRATKHVPAPKEMYDSYIGRQYYGPVAEQANDAKSWYRHNSEEVESIFAQMVNNVLHNNVSVATAIETAVRDINRLQ